VIRKIRDFLKGFFPPLKTQAPSSVGQTLRKVVYTCITGHYDRLISHGYVCGQWDYICFTDNQELLRKGHRQWKVYPLQFTALDHGRNSRWHKVFPDLILPTYDVSLYVDANIDIIAPDLFEYVNEMLLGKPEEILAIHPHYCRNCIYKEAQECLRLQLDDPDIINQHVMRLRELHYPENNGLQENNIIYRRHQSSRVKQLMEEWWWWIENHSKRDQLSFNYVLWKQNFKVHPFQKQFARNLKYGIVFPHMER
jgi:hypothetical protein